MVLIRDGQKGETPHKGAGEESGPMVHGHSGVVIDADAGQSATGGAALENKAAYVFPSEGLEPLFGPGEDSFRTVDAGLGCEKAGGLRVPDKMHRLSGDGQAIFHFRTDGDPIKPAAEGVNDMGGEPMAAVVTDVLPEKAGTDADPDLVHLSSLPIVVFFGNFVILRGM